MEHRLEQQIQFVIEVDKMKNILRQTLLTDKSRRENDAEHSWHLALMAMVLYEYADQSKVNLSRVLKMALVHDLIEIDAGDTFAYDDAGNESKAERERAAADRIFALLPEDQGSEIRALWEEFDAEETADAQYAAAIDRLQPLINNYVSEGHPWKIANITSGRVYKRMSIIKEAAPELWRLAEDIIQSSIEKGYLQK